MLHLTLEVRVPTPSQDQVLPALAPPLDHLVVPILGPTRHRRRTQEEAKGRVVTIVRGPGHTVIAAQGQGPPHTEDAIHGQGLQHLESSLALKGLYLKGKEKGSILTDTQKFQHTIGKLTAADLLTSEIHLKRKDTENGKGTIQNGMNSFTRAVLLALNLDLQ